MVILADNEGIRKPLCKVAMTTCGVRRADLRFLPLRVRKYSSRPFAGSACETRNLRPLNYAESKKGILK
jgi:hypothetical protein